MDDARSALAVACRARGIGGPEDFRRRYGVAPALLTPAAALALVTTPAWVTETWIPNAGRTPVAWVPEAVRAYAAALGIHRRESECDHAFTVRLQAAAREQRKVV